jgi:hypothetical protein
MRTLGSLILCRSLLEAGLVDRFRVVVLPHDYREHRPRPHLRRVSRCHPRDGCQPNVRQQTPAARVRPHGAHRFTRLAPRFLSAALLCDLECSRKAARTAAALLNLDNAAEGTSMGPSGSTAKGWAGRSAAGSETPTSRCRSATAGRRARGRGSPPGAARAATGIRVVLRSRACLPARRHVRP